MPSSEPSASITAAVLWYSPAARRSKSDATITTLVLLRERLERLGGRARNRLGELEEAVILDLAEILRAEQLLRADDLRPAIGRLLDERELPGEIGLGILAARHLCQRDADSGHLVNDSRGDGEPAGSRGFRSAAGSPAARAAGPARI